MPFDRSLLTDAANYFENQGLILKGPRSAKWKTTACNFHGGSDSMRVNDASGAWVCMAGCGARGGDILAYHMAKHCLGVIEAAKDLGAWVEDGKPQTQQRPAPLTPRAALTVLAYEANVAAVAAGNIGQGTALTDIDRGRLMRASARINRIAEIFL